MQFILLIIQIILACTLITVVLLQRNSSDSISGLSGNSTGIISNRSSANFLTRFTAIIAFLFMVNCLVLGNIAAKNSHPTSILDKIEKDQSKETDLKKDISLVPIAK